MPNFINYFETNEIIFISKFGRIYRFQESLNALFVGQMSK
jgi:hypothetical protein